MANITVFMEVKGIGDVVKKLRWWKSSFGRHLERGLVRAGAMLLRESKEYVPVQLGDLKASQEIRKEGAGLRTVVTIGYFGVEYAAYVHEIPNPPHAHGQEFNIKHADEIARAGRWSSSLKTHRTTFKPYGKMGTAAGGMFPRGPKQQYKYLERPLREKRAEVLRIIREEGMKATK